ncbi:MAG: Arc family DNA-binding protein [Bacteroides sp.]
MGGKNSYASIKRYEDKAYDKVLLRLPKGDKETIQAHAEAHSESMNGFINRAISETMERGKSAEEE